MGSQDKIVFINLQNTSNSLRKRAAYSKRFLNLRAKYCQPWKPFRAADCFYRLFSLSRRSYPRRYQDSIISVPSWHLQGNYQLERQAAVNFSQSLPEPVIWSHQLLSFAQRKVQQLWSRGQPEGFFFLLVWILRNRELSQQRGSFLGARCQDHRGATTSKRSVMSSHQ